MRLIDLGPLSAFPAIQTLSPPLGLPYRTTEDIFLDVFAKKQLLVKLGPI